MEVIEEAIALFKDGQSEKAIKLLENVVRKEDNRKSVEKVIPTLAEIYIQNSSSNMAKELMRPLIGKVDSVPRLKVQLLWAQLLMEENQYDAAKEFVISILSRIQPDGDKEILEVKGNLVGLQGHLYSRMGKMKDAKLCFLHAIEVLSAAEDLNRANAMRYNLASIMSQMGDYQDAISEFKSVASYQKQTNNMLGVGYSMMEMGGVYERMGQLEASMQCYEEENRLFQMFGKDQHQAWAQTDLGNGYLALGRPERALESYFQCLPYYKTSGDAFTTGNLYTYMSKAHRMLGDFGKALEDAKQARKYYEEISNSCKIEIALILEAWAYMELNDVHNLLEILETIQKSRSQDDTSADLAKLRNDFAGALASRSQIEGINGQSFQFV